MRCPRTTHAALGLLALALAGCATVGSGGRVEEAGMGRDLPRLFVMKGVRGRTPLDRIVVAPGSPEPVRFAAGQLQAYLRKSLGIEVPIAAGPPGKGALRIATAAQAPAELAAAGGFVEGQYDRSVVAVQGGGVLLLGENPRAALYAVYDFLHACLGVRFFGPGETHEVVPTLKMLALGPDLRQRTGSAFEFREYYLPQPDHAATVDFLMKNRVNTFCLVATLDAVPQAIRERGGLSHGPGHIFREFLPDATLFAAHPEYFSVIEGKRTVTGKGACFSNPEVRRIFTEKVRSWVRQHPYYDIFALWAEDSYYPCYCECAECAKVSTGGWYMTLINECAPIVEQELPGALFEFIAYHETRWPPKEVTPFYKNGRNMVLNICIGYSRNGFYTLNSRRDGNAEVRDMYAAWTARLAETGFAGRRLLFDYYNRCEIACGHGPAGQALIWPMDVIASDTRFYRDDGIRGLSDWVCFSRLCWPTPFNVWCWLQWYSTPDRPLAELENDFYPAYFGAAGPAVLAHTHALQEAMYASASPENVAQIAALDAPLAALSAGAGDPVLAHRLEVVRNHLQYCLLLKRLWLGFMANDETLYGPLLAEYNDFYPVTHRALLQDEIDIPSQFMNMYTEYWLKRPAEKIPETLRGLLALPSSR